MTDAPASLREPAGPDEIEPTVADPLIGAVVADRYRIIELLGRGGMGIVYKVEHVRLGKLLAMKLLTGELSRSAEVVRRFKQEALTASKLTSANTVQVFDFGAAEGLTYLVMELVAGEDMGRALRTGGPMQLERLATIVIQACASLAEAHRLGIVHRDIKPENIMLVRGQGGAEIAKVLDFGLAKLREGADLNDVTSQGAVVGTPYYMAPEQVRSEPVDGRADIYALGVLMYRALTGHYPFTGRTPMVVFAKHLHEAPTPPREREPSLGISEGASRVVLRALAKAAEDRFQTVDELRDAIIAETGASRSTRVDAPADRTIATRDEVEAYERKLRRSRYGSLVVAGIALAGAAAVAAKLATLSPKEEFAGLEREPNNTAAEANALPLGRPVNGFLGKRIDATRSDRDFYAFEVAVRAGGEPPKTDSGVIVRLKTTALPNMATCTLLYKQGLSTAAGRYCVGRAGRDLVIAALRLEPGRYLAAVMQDQDAYGAPLPPPVYENVSDTYTLAIDEGDAPREAAGPAREIEPNDQVASAEGMAIGEAREASLAWARDEDVFCVNDPASERASIRWTVTASERAAGAVVEVTPTRGGLEEAPVRVHASGKGPRSESDVMSPWTSPPMRPEAADEREGSGAPRCVRARLAQDPWTIGERGALIPNGGSEVYVIQVVASP